MPQVVIIAGPSGSGKTHLAKALGWPVLRLDDFYFDADEPNLPRSDLGIPDWDDPGSWNSTAALRAISELCSTGRTEVPIYDISLSRAVGRHAVVVEAPFFLAEGLFATEIVAACRDSGCLADAIVLVRPRLVTFFLRFARDLREGRKSPVTLLRRGWRLMHDDPAIIEHAIAAGCRPVSPQRARRELSRRVAQK